MERVPGAPVFIFQPGDSRPIFLHTLPSRLYIAEKKLNKSRALIPAILWLLISTILLTLPGSAFPKENWLTWIQFDKWIHFGMFALMVFLFCYGFYKRDSNTRKHFLAIAIIGIAYGIAMEFVQKYWVPNRSFDIGDILADAAGGLAGLWFSRRYIKK